MRNLPLITDAPHEILDEIQAVLSERGIAEPTLKDILDAIIECEERRKAG